MSKNPWDDYPYSKPLPDGRTIGVMKMTFGNYRVVIGNDDFLEDGY